MCCKCCGETQRKVWVFGLGSLFLVLGVLVVVFWPGIADSLVEDVSIFTYKNKMPKKTIHLNGIPSKLFHEAISIVGKLKVINK